MATVAVAVAVGAGVVVAAGVVAAVAVVATVAVVVAVAVGVVVGVAAGVVMRERDLQEQVRQLCADLGLYLYHTHDSRHSAAGFPDCWIINPKTGAVLYRELKTEYGQLSATQRAIGYALLAGRHDWAIWRPCDLADRTIARQLAQLAGLREKIA